MCDSKTIPQNFHQILQNYTENGYRVLALGSKNLDMDYTSIMQADRDEIENNFNFLGFFIVENKLKPVTTQIIS